MKKSHRQSARTPLPKRRGRFSFFKHPFLTLAGTWVFFALVAGISMEILVHPTGERRVSVESTQLEARQREFDAPMGWYGAIALICTAGSILVYRRYRQKVAGGLAQTKAKAKRRLPRPQPVVTTSIAPEIAHTPHPKTAPVQPKTRSRRRKPEVIPMTSDGYAPQPLTHQSTGTRNHPQVTVMPPSHSERGLVEAMDVRGKQSLDSLLRDR